MPWLASLRDRIIRVPARLYLLGAVTAFGLAAAAGVAEHRLLEPQAGPAVRAAQAVLAGLALIFATLARIRRPLSLAQLQHALQTQKMPAEAEGDEKPCFRMIFRHRLSGRGEPSEWTGPAVVAKDGRLARGDLTEEPRIELALEGPDERERARRPALMGPGRVNGIAVLRGERALLDSGDAVVLEAPGGALEGHIELPERTEPILRYRAAGAGAIRVVARQPPAVSDCALAAIAMGAAIAVVPLALTSLAIQPAALIAAFAVWFLSSYLLPPELSRLEVRQVAVPAGTRLRSERSSDGSIRLFARDPSGAEVLLETLPRVSKSGSWEAQGLRAALVREAKVVIARSEKP